MQVSRTPILFLAFGLMLSACSGEAESTVDDAGVDSPAVSEAASPSQVETPEVTEPAAADWSGINDAEVRTVIDKRLAAFSEEAQVRWSLLVVDKHEGDDLWQAAGMAAFDLGGPAIVVSTDQKDIQFVGDEALAYAVEGRTRLAKETAEFLDRGEFVEGVEHAIKGIKAIWNGE